MPTLQPNSHFLTVGSLDDGHHIVATVLGLLPAGGIVIIDLGWRIHRIEGAPSTRPGMAPGAVAGWAISDAMDPDLWAAAEPHWEAALAGKTGSLDWVAAGEAADSMLHFSPLRTPDGTVVGAWMVAQDLTERRQLDRQLERRARQHTALASLGTMALRDEASAALMKEACRIVETILGADVAAVLPYVSTGGLEIRAVSGDANVARPDPAAPAEPNVILDHMRDMEGPLVVADLRLSEFRAPILQAEGMLSLIVAPIGAPRDRYGLLGACSRSSDAFSREDVDFLQAIANTLAGSVERGRAADEVLRREAQLNEAERLLNIGSWEVDMDTGAATASNHLREMLGLGDGRLRVEDLHASVHDEDRERLLAYTKAIETQSAEPIEYRTLARDGTVRLVRAEAAEVTVRSSGERILAGTLRDVTEARRSEDVLRRSEERFRQGFDNAPIGMTLIDPLTGRYLRVNDAYSRMVGRPVEELLGLTFAAVVHPDQDEQTERTAYFEGDAEHLSTEARYLRPDGSVVWAAVSSSRVMGPDGTVDVLFSQIIDITERREREDALRRDVEEISWLKEINAALAEDRFELYGQPIVDLATGETVQHELLLRMRNADGELVAPGEFLPVAERYGLIRDIDRWVISRGVEIAATGMDVEINLSGTSMSDAGAIEDIDHALERTAADPSRLVFEITETAAIKNVHNARALAQRLRDRGCRFALDDFGTGFAGMSSLKALPLDYLKIDREFVKDLCTNEPDRQVLVATIQLARAFGLQTIAEGVEDQATLDLLRELGVDHAQGYFLGRPAPMGAGSRAAAR